MVARWVFSICMLAMVACPVFATTTSVADLAKAYGQAAAEVNNTIRSTIGAVGESTSAGSLAQSICGDTAMGPFRSLGSVFSEKQTPLVLQYGAHLEYTAILPITPYGTPLPAAIGQNVLVPMKEFSGSLESALSGVTRDFLTELGIDIPYVCTIAQDAAALATCLGPLGGNEVPDFSIAELAQIQSGALDPGAIFKETGLGCLPASIGKLPEQINSGLGVQTATYDTRLKPNNCDAPAVPSFDTPGFDYSVGEEAVQSKKGWTCNAGCEADATGKCHPITP